MSSIETTAILETAAIIVPVAVLLLIVRYGGPGWKRSAEECDGEARRASERKRNH